ncbi:MAG TPA: hypothetical protein DEO43_07485 [Halieaceae bacterium]|nr:hypothetical protein [Halieaceae bacterium]
MELDQQCSCEEPLLAAHQSRLCFISFAFTLLRKTSCPASLLPAVMLLFWFQTKISDLSDSVSDSPLI